MRIEWSNEHHETVTWSLRRKELAVLLAFAGTDETRPNLCALYFDESRGSIASTDGHRAVRVFGRKAENLGRTGPTFAAPLGMCLSLYNWTRELERGGELQIEIKATGSEAGFRTVNGPSIMRHVEGVAPAIDKVIPPKRDGKWRGVSAALNCSYLEDLNLISLACAFKLDKPKGKKELVRPGLVLEPPPDALSPWVARCSSSVYETEWEAVIMPMRV